MFQQIAISIEPISDNNRGMIRGVLDFVRTHPQYRVDKQGAIPYLPLKALHDWQGAGAICYADTPRELDRLAEHEFPVVCVALHQPPHAVVPVVHADNEAIGRRAAEHLLELGLKHFAFVGHLPWFHNQRRAAGFQQAIRAAGYGCTDIDVKFLRRRRRRSGPSDLQLGLLEKSLRKLPTPVGIFAAHDEFAHDVVQLLHQAEWNIPYDAAVVGVNDYRLICETSDPPLSSIAQSAHQIGFAAAKLLHELIAGAKPPKVPLLIPPGQLIARRSSDFSAVDDPLVIKAMTFIRDNCGSPITAEDVVEHSEVSRRTLDKRFLAALGHPAAEEIRLTRIKKARELLVTTDMQVMMVGLSCGYDSPSGFVRAFREATGTTPRQYRGNATRVR